MKKVKMVFNVRTNELEVHIDHDVLIIEDFKHKDDPVYCAILTPHAQEKLIKKLVANMSLTELEEV